MKSVEALAREVADGKVELCAPSVGWWWGRPAPGTPILVGGSLGELDTLGQRARLVAPVSGVVAAVGPAAAQSRAARVAVQFGDCLLVVDARAGLSGAGAGAGAGASAGSAGAGMAGTTAEGKAGELLFRAPSSGRFYSRSSPEEDPFVAAGEEISAGQVVCLLEVMKTFNRIEYGGDGLPARARVVAVLPKDGDDLEAGQPILSLTRVG